MTKLFNLLLATALGSFVAFGAAACDSDPNSALGRTVIEDYFVDAGVMVEAPDTPSMQVPWQPPGATDPGVVGPMPTLPPPTLMPGPDMEMPSPDAPPPFEAPPFVNAEPGFACGDDVCGPAEACCVPAERCVPVNCWECCEALMQPGLMVEPDNLANPINPPPPES